MGNSSRKHLRMKATPDLHLTYIKLGEIRGRYKIIDFNYSSIKSYVVGIFYHRLNEVMVIDTQNARFMKNECNKCKNYTLSKRRCFRNVGKQYSFREQAVKRPTG